MGIVLDIVAVAIAVLIIVIGTKKGFFKSLMSLISGIASIFIAYTFTPTLSEVLKAKFFLPKFAGSIQGTLASIADTGSQNYDVSKLVGNSQFTSIVERYGADTNTVNGLIDTIKDKSYTAVEAVSESVADKIAGTVSTLVAFIVLFIASILVLKLLTYVIGMLFKLPVLHALDKTLGIVFGVVSALIFVLLFSVLMYHTGNILVSVIPGTFKSNIVDSSFIIKYFAKLDILSLLNLL